ncbi:hypothetical protein A7E78_02070 [Syntrophotalea acetylenivorans]|uniref:Uncharacterized protein n=1 Tax=Syntrophotalea acetylenivorans TaxID=1842532 RepID=A0A1L3GLH8_9BACT|nr:hypothetical protein [Syntrophotalea acetylenivorans]APG26750.1 hypothetical protein A7E78_02070 [Syntrophotalea acetylenivorans]
MKKTILLIVGLSVFLLSGCYVCNKANWPEQPVLDHMNTMQKTQYLNDVKQNLINFRTTAVDLESHRLPHRPDEDPADCQRTGFHCEVARYVEVYAMPVLNDGEALQNLETRLEVAKINLLSAYALYETGSFGQARSLLKMYDKRYRKDVAIETAMVDNRDMEFATLGEAAQNLRSKLTN